MNFTILPVRFVIDMERFEPHTKTSNCAPFEKYIIIVVVDMYKKAL